MPAHDRRNHGRKTQRALLLRVFSNDPPRALLIAAHPDDETIGASVALARLRSRATVAYATDGAPADGIDARRSGYARSADYAAARLREATAALALAGVPSPLAAPGIGDQQSAHRLVDLVHAIASSIDRFAPELILTHAFEGGHPATSRTRGAASGARVNGRSTRRRRRR